MSLSVNCDWSPDSRRSSYATNKLVAAFCFLSPQGSRVNSVIRYYAQLVAAPIASWFKAEFRESAFGISALLNSRHCRLRAKRLRPVRGRRTDASDGRLLLTDCCWRQAQAKPYPPETNEPAIPGLPRPAPEVPLLRCRAVGPSRQALQPLLRPLQYGLPVAGADLRDLAGLGLWPRSGEIWSCASILPSKRALAVFQRCDQLHLIALAPINLS